MDPVSSGASVLAFVLLGIKSATLLYQTLQSIEGGPRSVSRAADNAIRLHSVLRQLSQSSAGLDDANLALRAQLRRCSGDLDDFAAAITALHIGSGERRHVVLWKSLRVLLAEKDIEEMDRIISHHISTLSLHLNVLQSNIAYTSRDRLASLAEASQSLQLHAESQAVAQSSALGVLRDHSSLLSAMDEKLDGLKNDCGSVRDAVAALPSVSPSQADTMMQMLRELQGQVSALSQQASHPRPPLETRLAPASSNIPSQPLHAMQPVPVDHNASLVESIQGLSDLVHNKVGTMNVYDGRDSEEAEDVIRGLQSMLKAATELGSAERRGEDASLRTDFKRFERLFSASPMIALNHHPGPGSPLTAVPGRSLIRQERRIRKIQARAGTLTLVMNTRKRRPTPQEGEVEDFVANVTFVPFNYDRLHMVSACINQRGMFSGIRLQIPRLDVNRLLSSQSLVFTLVRQGRMEEFQALLASGKASLRDHDEVGAPLLFYATRQPEMCRFLLEKGADVDYFGDLDEVEPWHGRSYGTVLDKERSDRGLDDAELDLINQCRRMLLEAGADPTVVATPLNRSYLRAITRLGREESVFLSWNLSGAFVDGLINDQEHIGHISFEPMLFDVLQRQDVSKEVVRLLLQKGANTRAQTSKGSTCLHVYLQTLQGDSVTFGQETGCIEQQEVLRCLIEYGADVRAQDREGWQVGRKVSDVAYRKREVFKWSQTETPPSRESTALKKINSISMVTAVESSYVGDLWDSTLVACGYDLLEFRRFHSRRPAYGGRYTREIFERLWHGQEEKCPYWDDRVWPEGGPDPDAMEAEDDEEDPW
ncbi:hypothetical protein QBC47DRAFT_116439 [Echria macrotheca]|uniref:Azaphilone pigments biosynthesis cluster protein L N-terminal domain-containing protein n=1 Tax=Echria macrotheca TaxID=438768 RepID=A0AAJ0BKU9_9PEZI|nr:hypothetical protein QBC47DRAFT_116439 [Echria macrotheca]